VIARLWRQLAPRERRRLIGIVPLLVLSAVVEIVGVAAVIPFLALLADPYSVRTLPVVGPWVVASGIEDPSVLLRWAGATLALTLLLANGLVMGTQWWLLRFSWSVNHAISSRLVGHYLAQPYAFVLDRNTAELANRVVTVVRQVVDHGLSGALNIISRSVVIFALVAFLVALDPVTAIVAFVTLGSIYGTIFILLRRYLRRIGHESVTTGTARLKAVNEALGGFKDLRVAGREASAYRQFLEPSRRFGEIEAGWTAVATLPRHALEAVAVGGLVLIASLMSGAGVGVTGTLPLLGAYAFAGLRMMPALQALFGAVARIRFAGGSLDAIEADFGYVKDLEPMTEREPTPMPFEGAIELRDVRFGYAGADAQALKGVSLAVAKHRSLAIVGRTGSGKTTLVDVLLGLLTPQSGRVLVDGEPVARDQRRSYRRIFGYVPQSIYLLDDTIERNVAFGLAPEEIDPEAVKRACREAQIADFIESELPHGYATEVGERGVRLSGGQRQRIGIARALYHQPAVLVFDEATSALDVHTEEQVYRALEGIARDRTVVTIAHRLETVAKADHVVVLEHGRVVDQGPPGEVLGRYRGEVVA
jgi:ATP-binding cassette, subfamily B, bacterial PglK